MIFIPHICPLSSYWLGIGIGLAVGWGLGFFWAVRRITRRVKIEI